MDHSQTLARDRSDDDPDRDIGFASARPTPAEQLSLPIALPTTAGPTAAGAPATRGFAGFSYAQLIAGALVVAASVWGMWATSKIFALDDRRVVSVRLAAIVNDFVTAEARSGTPPEQLAARTKAFMTALDAVLKARAEQGQVVLVGEAVVASSVPDVTSDVVTDLSKIVKLAAPAAMPPALLPSLPVAPSSSPSSSAPAPTFDTPAVDPLASPFGAPTQPVPQR